MKLYQAKFIKAIQKYLNMDDNYFYNVKTTFGPNKNYVKIEIAYFKGEGNNAFQEIENR